MRPPGIQCQLCPMTFSDQSAISAHYDTVHAHSNTRAPTSRPEHPDAKYPCDVCGRKFTQSSNLRIHLRTYHNIGDVKTFQCNVCSKSFKHKVSLKSHLTLIHGLGDIKTFQCSECLKVFKQNCTLLRHVRQVHKLTNA